MKYGLIAGNGRFPFLVLEGAQRRGVEVVVAAIKEETAPEIDEQAAHVEWIGVGQLGKLIRFFKGEAVYKPGFGFTAGGGRTQNGDDAWAAVRAFEATTGKLKWEFKLLSPGFSSLLSTAGGLVFGGTDEGNFFALDAETGKPLWDTQLGANIRGIPVSFAIDGKQYVAIGAGFALFERGTPIVEDRLRHEPRGVAHCGSSACESANSF